MDTSSLGKLAGEIAKAGLPALAGALGGPGASAIANAVIGALAGSTATPAQPQTADEAAKVIAENPEAARVALAALNIQQTAADMQREIAAAEMARENWFSWGWRPAWAWMAGWLVLWSLFCLPVLNATIQITFSLPHPPIVPVPFDILAQVVGWFLTLYMGGHTAIRVVQAWKGADK